MAVTNKSRANWKPEDRQGYVIYGRELEDFAANLKVNRAHRIANLLRGVATLLDELAGQEIDNVHLQAIRQVAREENHRQYRRLMAKIVEAIRKGGEAGRRASKLTITRYLEILLDEPLSSCVSFEIKHGRGAQHLRATHK